MITTVLCTPKVPHSQWTSSTDFSTDPPVIICLPDPSSSDLEEGGFNSIVIFLNESVC